MSATVIKSIPVSFSKPLADNQTTVAITIALTVCTLGGKLIDMIGKQDAIHVKISAGDINFEVDKETRN